MNFFDGTSSFCWEDLHIYFVFCTNIYKSVNPVIYRVVHVLKSLLFQKKTVGREDGSKTVIFFLLISFFFSFKFYSDLDFLI